MSRHTALPAVALVLALLSGGTALATTGRLPGRTPIGVTITVQDPAARTHPGATTRTVLVQGTASVGRSVTPTDTTLIYVLDASGSTVDPAGGDCGPDQTPDDPESAPDEVIDCEIAAATKLNDAAVAAGGVARVAMVSFAGDAVVADATPGGHDDPLTTPDADANHNHVRDVTEVLRSIQVAKQDGQASGFATFTPKRNPAPVHTNFAAAIGGALGVARLARTSRVVVVMLSDGIADTGQAVADVLPAAHGDKVVFDTFAVGAGASCAGNQEGMGGLGDIARLTGGGCIQVKDPSHLPRLLPGVVKASLTSLAISVGGGPAVPIPAGRIHPGVPRQGPASVSYQTSVPVTGTPKLCVRAQGADAGGSGSVAACAFPVGGVATGAGGMAAALVPASRSAQPAPAAPPVGGRVATRPGMVVVPAINLAAEVIGVGLNPDRTLQVPADFDQAGWYRGGPAPGAPGAAVIVGHVDSWSGPAVFYRLRQLRPGDQITVVGAGGTTTRFVVDRLDQYPKDHFPTTRVYGATSGPALRLITCGGAFDARTRSYLNNLVVSASLAHGSSAADR
jgi:hypothetical protein